MMKAILTGHARGLGQAIATELLTREIPVLGLSRGDCPDFTRRFPHLAEQVSVDLSDPHALLSWLETGCLTRYLADASGVLLINNAGMLGPVGAPGRQDSQEIMRAVSLNVAAPLVLCDAVARVYCGSVRIAHVSSGAGRNPIPGWSIYGATKAALDHHARCVVADSNPRLRICSIAPGVIDTEMQGEIRGASIENFPLLGRFQALKENGELSSPEETGRKLVDYFLCDHFGAEAVADLRSLP